MLCGIREPHMKIPSLWFIGFCGHREFEDLGMREVIRQELIALRERVEGGLIGHSQVAIGADQIFLGECEALGLPIEISIPLEQGDFRQDFDAIDWEHAAGFLSRAVRVNEARTGELRPDAYRTCGIEIVDVCDLVMAVWDGSEARGPGGTAEIVAYARQLNRPIVWIHAGTLSVTYENFPKGRFQNPMVQTIRKTLESEIWKTESLDSGGCREAVEGLFSAADSYATRTAPNVRRLTMTVIALNFVVVALGSMGAILESSGYEADSRALQAIATVRFLLLTTVFVVAATHFLKSRKRRWLACRFVAEFSRSLLATWNAAPGINRLPHAILPEFSHLTRSLTFLNEAGHRITQQADVSCYIKDRIEHQIDYYKIKSAGLDRTNRKLQMVLWIPTVLAPLIAAFCALKLRFGVGWEMDPVIFSTLRSTAVLLPMLGTSVLSLISIYEINRRISQNHRMIGLLESAKFRLSATPSPNAAAPVIQSIEQALTGENVDWYFHNRYGK